jgi:hypothetical protein
MSFSRSYVSCLRFVAVQPSGHALVPLRDALLGTLSLPIEQQSLGCSVVFSDAMSLHGDVSGEVCEVVRPFKNRKIFLV